MVDVPDVVLLADGLLLLAALFTALVWCPFMIRITEWHKDPVTLRKMAILFVGLFVPLALTWFFVELFLPQALLWSGG